MDQQQLLRPAAFHQSHTLLRRGMSESLPAFVFRFRVLAVEQQKIRILCKCGQFCEAVFIRLLVRGIDQRPAIKLQPEHLAAAGVITVDGIDLQSAGFHRIFQGTDVHVPCIVPEGQRPIGRLVYAVQQRLGIFPRGSGNVDVRALPLLGQSGIHAQAQDMVQVQVAQQDDRRHRKVRRRGNESAARVQKYGLLPRLHHVAGGGAAESRKFFSACRNRSSCAEDSKCKRFFRHLLRPEIPVLLVEEV